MEYQITKINLKDGLTPSSIILNNKSRNSPTLQPIPIFTAIGNNKEKKPYTIEYVSKNNTKITIKMMEALDSRDQTIFLAINSIFNSSLQKNKDNSLIKNLKENKIKSEDLIKNLKSLSIKTTLKTLMEYASLDYTNNAVRERVLKSLDRLSNVIIKTENTKLVYKDLLIKYVFEKKGDLHIGMNPSNVYSNLDISNGYISHNFKERILLPVGTTQLLHYVLSGYSLNSFSYTKISIKDLLNKIKNLNQLAKEKEFINLSLTQKNQKLKDLRKTILKAFKNFEEILGWKCIVSKNIVEIKIKDFS